MNAAPPRAPDDLVRLREAVWEELVLATASRGHGWRHAVLATAGPHGPDARTVVLRDADAAHRRIAIYSDRRSPKVLQLRVDPRALLVAWCPQRAWQLRLQLQVTVVDSGLDVSSRWARLKLTPAAQDYLSPLPPGTPVESPGIAADVGPGAGTRAAGPIEPNRDTREHFCVLWAQVQAIDWLELRPEGHRRARFDADGDRWLTP